MAIDPHNHIYPQGFMDDVRQGRFGQTVTIEPGNGFEWISFRGKILGNDFEVRNKLFPPAYEPELRIKDMARMGVDRQILSVSPALTLYTLDAEANKEIAAIMGLSKKTVEFHRTKIRKKLGLKTRKHNLKTHLLSFE